MSLPYIELSDAVVDYINAQTYSQSVVAVRKYEAVNNKQALSTLKCTVIPGPIDREEETFGTGTGKELFEQEVWIVLQQRVKNNNYTQIDPLVSLLMEIHDSLRRTTFDLTTSYAQWTDSRDIVPFDADNITSGVYMGAFAVVYSTEVS